MTTHSRELMVSVILGLLVLTGVGVAGPQAASGPPRYEAGISNGEDLMRLFAAGLVGDAFGYDGREVLFAAQATNMPTEDIVPTFYMAFLSGRSYLDVVDLRVKRMTWGQITEKLGVTADMLNSMAIPSQLEITEPREVPDTVLADLFVCSAISQVFNIHPDEIMAQYSAEWTWRDVLAAVEIGYRTRRPFTSFLDGPARQVDWLSEARRVGLSMAELQSDGGRCFDNRVPVASATPQRGDLETLQAMEFVSKTWGVPMETIATQRARYLYSPSELIIAFYLADLGHTDCATVGKLYAWSHWRRWGPTIVELRIPSSHFATLTIWRGGLVDFSAVDPLALHHALLAAALAVRVRVPATELYARFDPYFGPSDAILYSWFYDRHHVPFSDYYAWCRARRPWREHPRYHEVRGDYQRSIDRLGGRRVGIIIGDKGQPGGRGSVQGGGPPGPLRGRPSLGATVGGRTWDGRSAPGRWRQGPGERERIIGHGSSGRSGEVAPAPPRRNPAPTLQRPALPGPDAGRSGQVAPAPPRAGTRTGLTPAPAWHFGSERPPSTPVGTPAQPPALAPGVERWGDMAAMPEGNPRTGHPVLEFYYGMESKPRQEPVPAPRSSNGLPGLLEGFRVAPTPVLTPRSWEPTSAPPSWSGPGASVTFSPVPSITPAPVPSFSFGDGAVGSPPSMPSIGAPTHSSGPSGPSAAPAPAPPAPPSSGPGSQALRRSGIIHRR